MVAANAFGGFGVPALCAVEPRFAPCLAFLPLSSGTLAEFTNAGARMVMGISCVRTVLRILRARDRKRRRFARYGTRAGGSNRDRSGRIFTGQNALRALAGIGSLWFHIVSRDHQSALQGGRCRPISLGAAAQFVSAFVHSLLCAEELVFTPLASSCVRRCDPCCVFSLVSRRVVPLDRTNCGVFGRSVCLLHGLPWRTGAAEAGREAPHALLLDGGRRRRDGRRVRRGACPTTVLRVLGVSRRARRDRGAALRGSFARSGIVGAAGRFERAVRPDGYGRAAAGEYSAGGPRVESREGIVTRPSHIVSTGFVVEPPEEKRKRRGKGP